MKHELISMTEFMLQKEQQVISETNARIKAFSSTHLNECFAYAKFLKQPLTLGMFVPCIDSYVLEEPKTCCSGSDCGCMGLPYNVSSMKEVDDYFDAISKVYFEGFKISDCTTFVYMHSKNHSCNLNLSELNEYTIEDLVSYGLTLTPYAKELIYGN